MDFDADFKILYSDCAQRCSLFGEEFFGFLKTVDISEYETAIISTHTLRYPYVRALSTGDLVTVDGVDYKVAAKPERINTRESIAHLVKQ